MGQYEPEDSRKVTHDAKPDAAGLKATGAREAEARRDAQGEGSVKTPEGVRTTPPRGQQDDGASPLGTVAPQSQHNSIQVTATDDKDKADTVDAKIGEGDAKDRGYGGASENRKDAMKED